MVLDLVLCPHWLKFIQVVIESHEMRLHLFTRNIFLVQVVIYSLDVFLDDGVYRFHFVEGGQLHGVSPENVVDAIQSRVLLYQYSILPPLFGLQVVKEVVNLGLFSVQLVLFCNQSIVHFLQAVHESLVRIPDLILEHS